MSTSRAVSRRTTAPGKKWTKAKYTLNENSVIKRRQRPVGKPVPARQPSRPPDQDHDGGSAAGLGSRGPTRASTRIGTRMDRLETATMYTEGSYVTRNLYLAPPGGEPLHVKKFVEYVEDMEIEIIFKDLLKLLLNRPELPYNPFPGFTKRFRRYSEKFHIMQQSEERIMEGLLGTVKETYMPSLYTLQGQETVWGLPSVLRAVRPDRLNKYKWMVDSLSTSQQNLPSLDNYTNQATIALVGPCIFEGSFFAHCYNVQLRKEFLISGEDLDKGMELFVNSVVAEVDAMYAAMYESSKHHIVGVNIPKTSSLLLGSPEFIFWDKKKIEANKDQFRQAIHDTVVVHKKYVHVECTFCLDPEIHIYTKGQIQYGLSFIQVAKETAETESLTTFSEFPMSCLHEGVFLSQSHAESYLALHTAEWKSHSKDKGPQPSKTDKKDKDKDKKDKDKKDKKPGEEVSAARPISETLLHDMTDFGPSTRHMVERLEHTELQKTLIDGFSYSDEDPRGPFSAEITKNFKKYLQHKIASYDVYTQMFDICFCMILLLLLERKSFNRRLGVDVYRILHGTSGRLHYVMEQNKCVSYIIQTISNTIEVNVIKEHLNMYRESITHLFQDSLSNRSTEQKTLANVIVGYVDDLMNSEKMNIPFASVPYVHKAVEILNRQYWYSLSLMIQLIDDSVQWIPKLVDFIKAMKSEMPEAAQRPETRQRTRRDVVGEEVVVDVEHGMEDDHIKNSENYYIDVESCMQRDTTVPKLIAHEAVLLKYLVDTHLDQLWHDYLLDLATEPFFPPNPFPKLVSIFRQASMRMDVCYRKPQVIAENMYSAENMKLEDSINFVYHIPGVDCHGTFTALAVLDTGAYVPLSENVAKLEQKSYIKKRGAYRVAICMAISGPSILYGKMQPYLNEVELHEHIYIKGPPGCQGEAIQLFATIVYNHVTELIHTGTTPVMGVYFTEAQHRWSWQELLSKKVAFLTECAAICRNKEPIFMKTFFVLEWRYIAVKKLFQLHFITDEATKPEIFFPEDPIALYTSIFLAKERAAFHFQNGGPRAGGNPMSYPNIMYIQKLLDIRMKTAEKHCDWMAFHRDLVLKSVLFQNKRFLADPWRMFHCIAANLEYVIYMTDTLRDLVLLFMEHLAVNKASEVIKDVSKKKKGVKEKPKEKEGPVSEAVLGRMFMIFFEKLLSTCEDKNLMMPAVFPLIIQNKLNLIIEEDPRLDNFYLAYDDLVNTNWYPVDLRIAPRQQTLSILEELRNMLCMNRDSVAADVHDICVDAKAVLRNISTYHHKLVRSSSVTSEDFTDTARFKVTKQRMETTTAEMTE